MPFRDPTAQPSVTLTKERARRLLVSHHGLTRPTPKRGLAGVRQILGDLRCIQLDPLDAIGTNAELVTAARVDGVGKGDVFRGLFPGRAFEHFAKERCILPADAFPYYRSQAIETPWWRLRKRLERCPKEVLEAVLREVTEKGPATARELTHHGRVEALDWHGWKGTGRMTSMALEVLWTQCRVVVAGRSEGGEKRYDLPERALPEAAPKPPGAFARWALLERVRAAGLLRTAGGPQWSMLRDVRTGPLPQRLVDEGALVRVQVAGSTRTYYAEPATLARRSRPLDDRLRILGPLDPMIWDRELVQNAFGFRYVWEVYKPKSQREWGWYVCPLLHRGELVGRVEATTEGRVLSVRRLWGEASKKLDRSALADALLRHADFLRIRWDGALKAAET